MRHRSSCGVFVVLVAAVACGNGNVNGFAEDDSALTAAERPATTAPCGTSAGQLPCPPPPADAGSPPPADAGSPPPPVDAAPPVCVPPDVFGTSKWKHGFVGDAVLGSEKQVTVHGEACLDCHTNPTNPHIPKFDYGGRVFDAQMKPAARVEVRVTNTKSGNPISAYSNQDGYFWWPPPKPVDENGESGGYGGGGLFSPPPDVARFPTPTAARSEKGKDITMCAQAPHGNCGTCHTEKLLPLKLKP